MKITNKNQLLGNLFEEILYNKLKELNIFDEIYYERDLLKKYGWHSSSIDYLLVYKNKFIVLQLKWRNTKRKENLSINNFVKSTLFMQNRMHDKEYMCGFWISRLKPFDDNISFLAQHSINYVSCQESMDKLANLAQSKIKTLFNNMI